jgi:hypothetical protein
MHKAFSLLEFDDRIHFFKENRNHNEKYNALAEFIMLPGNQAVSEL